MFNLLGKNLPPYSDSSTKNNLYMHKFLVLYLVSSNQGRFSFGLGGWRKGSFTAKSNVKVIKF